MTVVLDLTQRHWATRRGEITGIGTWVRVSNRWRPCMVLVRTGEEMADATIPCCITVDKAWIWSEDIGDPQQAARLAFGFAESLRLSTEPRTIFRIARFIHDHLGDLLTIPPFPPAASSNPIADVTITNRETGKTTEVVLTDV